MRWHLYAFAIPWTLMDLEFIIGSQPLSLYLKAYNPQTYFVVQAIILGTIFPAIDIVAALAAGIAADRLGRF